MQELKDVLSIEAKVLRQQHSSVWHAVRNSILISILNFVQNINGSLGVIGSKYEMESEKCLSPFGVIFMKMYAQFHF